MSRKDYRAMAQVIAQIADSAERKGAAQRAAQVFASDNPRFDAARFYAACNVQ